MAWIYLYLHSCTVVYLKLNTIPPTCQLHTMPRKVPKVISIKSSLDEHNLKVHIIEDYVAWTRSSQEPVYQVHFLSQSFSRDSLLSVIFIYISTSPTLASFHITRDNAIWHLFPFYTSHPRLFISSCRVSHVGTVLILGVDPPHCAIFTWQFLPVYPIS